MRVSCSGTSASCGVVKVFYLFFGKKQPLVEKIKNPYKTLRPGSLYDVEVTGSTTGRRSFGRTSSPGRDAQILQRVLDLVDGSATEPEGLKLLFGRGCQFQNSGDASILYGVCRAWAERDARHRSREDFQKICFECVIGYGDRFSTHLLDLVIGAAELVRDQHESHFEHPVLSCDAREHVSHAHWGGVHSEILPFRGRWRGAMQRRVRLAFFSFFSNELG